MAVQMTNQSSKEALTLVENYFQELMPERNISLILGEYLNGYSIHHQLLSASYNVGGPSAGFALAINTLSILLQIPVLNDFGITGAPWIKGSRKGDVGASVIIGGHQKKTEKVLLYLERMYMPLQNYRDMDPQILEAYRAVDKDVIGVRSFSALVPEVCRFSQQHHQKLKTFFKQRLVLERAPLDLDTLPEDREKLTVKAESLRLEAEAMIRRRLVAIEEFVRQEGDRFRSLERIFDDMGDNG